MSPYPKGFARKIEKSIGNYRNIFFMIAADCEGFKNVSGLVRRAI
jgi:hypothetical protein